MERLVLTDAEVRGVRISTTPLAALQARVNDEAEARSHLAGQFHEAIAELKSFAIDAHTVIEINEANVFALTKQHERLIDTVAKYVEHTDARMDAISTALQAVWEATKPMPRPTLWRRIFG